MVSFVICFCGEAVVGLRSVWDEQGQESVTDKKEPGVVTDCHCRHSVESDSLQPQGLQHARLTCPPLSPRVCSSSCPLSRCCHPTISSSVVPFSSCLQSFPPSGSFPVSQFFASGGPSIGFSASASVLPMNIGLISFRIVWFDLHAAQGTLKSRRYVVMKREGESLALTGWSLTLDVHCGKGQSWSLKTLRGVSSSGSLGPTPLGLPSSVTRAAALEGSLALTGLWGKQTRTREGVQGRT